MLCYSSDMKGSNSNPVMLQECSTIYKASLYMSFHLILNNHGNYSHEIACLTHRIDLNCYKSIVLILLLFRSLL